MICTVSQSSNLRDADAILYKAARQEELFSLPRYMVFTV
jgi:hypothetical protein